jgi:hypothetical protein
MYLAISGLIIGLVIFAISLVLAEVVGNISDEFLRWTTRVRGISAMVFSRTRIVSDGVARFLIRIREPLASVETGYRVFADTAYSAWHAIMRKFHD